MLMPDNTAPLPYRRDFRVTPSTSAHISEASARTSRSAPGCPCKLGERSGHGPSTTAPSLTNRAIFVSSSGRMVSSSGSTSNLYCVPCGRVSNPSRTDARSRSTSPLI